MGILPQLAGSPDRPHVGSGGLAPPAFAGESNRDGVAQFDAEGIMRVPGDEDASAPLQPPAAQRFDSGVDLPLHARPIDGGKGDAVVGGGHSSVPFIGCSAGALLGAQTAVAQQSMIVGGW